MELLDRAMALCVEIEQRQAELCAVLQQLAVQEQSVDHIVPPQHSVEDAYVREDPPAPVIELETEIEIDPDRDPASDPAHCVTAEPEPEVDDPVACEEVIVPVASRNSTDIRKAFTINDRFRFRRELFGGDDMALKTMIDNLSSVSGYDDAMAVIASYGWDDGQDAVKELKELIANFYNGYVL